jgi:hypothetical protein
LADLGGCNGWYGEEEGEGGGVLHVGGWEFGRSGFVEVDKVFVV